MNRLVNLFLESAEIRVKGRQDLTLDFWRENVKSLLTYQGMDILDGNGHVSNQEMEDYVRAIYADFDSRRKSYDATLADEEDMTMLEDLENEVKDKAKKNE